jgi:putative ABC transport system permease protein
MDFFIANLKQAYHYLKKNTIYSVLTIIGLTVGLTVFLLVALFVYNEKSVDKSIPNSNRIYRLIDAEKRDSGLDYNLQDAILENFPEIEANCMLERYEWVMILRANNKSVKLKSGISTTNSFFKVFDIPILRKIDDKPFSEKASIILTQASAKKLFGNKDPLGQTLDVNHFFKVKVTAIIKEFPKNTSIEADYLLNAEDKKMRMSTICENGCYNPMNSFFLLKKHTDKDQFIKHFNQTIKQFQSRVKRFSLQPLTDIYLAKQIKNNGNRKGNPSFINIISIIALIILILSVINYLNFSLSLQFSKIKEISIKKVNGANGLQLFFYYLTESLIVITTSTLLSLLLVFALKDYFTSLIGREINLQILEKPVFVIIYLTVLLLILGINSIIPVYSLLKINVVDGLHNTVKRQNKSSIRTLFTTTQFVASIALLISVFFIQKQLNFVESRELGFNRQNLLKIEIPFGFKHFPTLKAEINNLSFVKSSSYSFGHPGQINLTMGSGEKDIDMNIKTIMVDSTFLRTFKIQLLKGHQFLKGDFHKACMFNKTAIKQFGWKDPLKMKYAMGKEGGYQVIGVVNNFSVSSLRKKQQAVCLIYDDTNKPTVLSVRIVPGYINQQISAIKKIWASLTKDPFDFQFYDDFFNAQYKKERQLSRSITALAIIAIMLTLIGILGQVIQTCNYRTKEIGIRKVNGAAILEIVNMLNMAFVKWVLFAFVIATPIAWYGINKWLENFPYKTTLSWWVFALAGIIVLFVTLVTVSLKTFKVAIKNPVEALQYE